MVNIVYNPCRDVADVFAALLTIGGTNLKNSVQINSNHFRPISSLVPFSVEAPNILVKLTLPRWNTHSVNASSHHTDIGRIGQFKLDGHYRYFSEVTPDNMDQLKLDMTVGYLPF